ncbi:MAG: hypothetical protein M0R46_12040 [Candidatus Muirbacterium halophilum]|nr:hypothetical protein [Candidatus Muirbacterium halophilum]MCK9476646.1 hypothetical protein [Candidatus Muirbacterium halophilum]
MNINIIKIFLVSDFKQLIFNKITWIQIIYLQLFTWLYSFLRFKPENSSDYHLFILNYIFASGLSLLMFSNYLIFDFSFVKFKQKRIIENTMVSPASFLDVVFGKALACVLFNVLSIFFNLIFVFFYLKFYQIDFLMLQLFSFLFFFSFSFVFILAVLTFNSSKADFFNTIAFVMTVIMLGIVSFGSYRIELNFNMINVFTFFFVIISLFTIRVFKKNFNKEFIIRKV